MSFLLQSLPDWAPNWIGMSLSLSLSWNLYISLSLCRRCRIFSRIFLRDLISKHLVYILLYWSFLLYIYTWPFCYERSSIERERAVQSNVHPCLSPSSARKQLLCCCLCLIVDREGRQRQQGTSKCFDYFSNDVPTTVTVAHVRQTKGQRERAAPSRESTQIVINYKIFFLIRLCALVENSWIELSLIVASKRMMSSGQWNSAMSLLLFTYSCWLLLRTYRRGNCWIVSRVMIDSVDCWMSCAGRRRRLDIVYLSDYPDGMQLL